jgi:hypothetical protein
LELSLPILSSEKLGNGLVGVFQDDYKMTKTSQQYKNVKDDMIEFH